MISLAWMIRVSPRALKQLRKLDKPVAREIRDALSDIGSLDDPRCRGKALSGNLRGLWRYRVGDYRIICDILDGELVVLVVEIGHRGEIYRSR